MKDIHMPHERDRDLLTAGTENQTNIRAPQKGDRELVASLGAGLVQELGTRGKEGIQRLTVDHSLILHNGLQHPAACINLVYSISLLLHVTILAFFHTTKQVRGVQKARTEGVGEHACLKTALQLLLVGCLTSQHHAGTSQRQITDKRPCCRAETEVADQTVHLIQSVYWYQASQSQHWSYNARHLAG